MITIEVALAVLATAPMVLAAILAVCAAGMNRAQRAEMDFTDAWERGYTAARATAERGRN